MKESIVLIGLPGSGKSTIGALLSQKLGMTFTDIDGEIERYTGKKISQLFEKGEDHFRKIETEMTQILAKEKQSVISTGGGVVLRPENMVALSQHGLIIFLNRSVQSIKGDIKVDDRPLLKDSVEQLTKLANDRQHLYQKYAELTIENDGSVKDTLEQIIEQLPASFRR